MNIATLFPNSASATLYYKATWLPLCSGGTCSITAIAALGGNLGGVTSWLLGLDGGQLAGQLHADVLVPVLDFKRCVDAANGYGELLMAVQGESLMGIQTFSCLM